MSIMLTKETIEVTDWDEKFAARPGRTSFGIGVTAIMVGLGLSVVGGAGFFVLNIASQPARILSKTLDADNVIRNYEWFFDANAQVNSRVSQIAGHKAIIAETTDASELSRLRIELAAIQQSCRDLTQRYDANAMKLNAGMFRDWRLPETLDPTHCETEA